MASIALPSGLVQRLARSHARGEVSGAAWSLGDQALVSMGNFVTTLLLARALSPAAFGSFVVLYTGLLFANSLQICLITRPHNVLAAPLEGADYDRFTASAAGGQLIFAGALTVLVLVVAFVGNASGLVGGGVLFVLAAALFAWQGQEFVRQIAYTRGRADRAFVYDLVSYGGQAAAIIILWRLDALTVESALAALAITSGLSAAWGAWQIRLHVAGALPALRESWHLVKWGLPDTLGQWLSAQTVPLLVAGLTGLSGVGAMKAVQTLIAPSHIIMNTMQAFVTPRGARAYSGGGYRALVAFLRPTALLAALPLVAFWLTISLLARPLLHFLYNGLYDQYVPLVWLFCLSYLVLHVVQSQSLGLVVAGAIRAVVIGRGVSIVLTFTVGAVLIWWFGVYGALVGSLISWLGMGAVLTAAFARLGSENDKRGTLAPEALT